MAILQTEQHSTKSNIEGRRIAMRFDPESTVHLMSLLTEAYTDPEMAVVREYSVNGLDSHVEAGQTRPIEVITPTALTPKLIIRDFGVGLNQHDIETVFSLYGASTKRESNDQVGGLGIGGKSALAYTSQFTVVGIKGGVKTVVDVAMDDEGAGSMTIVETVDTDEHNGVEIQVPCARENEFENKAAELFQYWTPGTVLLNGKEPKHLDGLKLTDNMILVERQGYGSTSVVIMGSVPYEIPREYEPLKNLLDGRRVVATVPIGSMFFTPSRERLKLNAKTKTALEALNVEGQKALAESIKADVDAASSKHEALVKALKWKSSIDGRSASQDVQKALETLTYKGEAIPKTLQLPSTKNPQGEDVRPKFRTTNRTYGKLSDSDLQTYLEARTALNTIIVTGYTADTFTPSHKKKLNVWANQEELEGEQYALFNGQLPEDLDWFNRPIVRWEDVKQIKLERTYVEGARKQLQGSYDVHEGGAYTVEKKADELEGDIYYYTTDTFKVHGYNAKEKETQALRQLAQLFSKYRPDAILVRLGLNRVTKFGRDFPEAKEAKAELIVMHNSIMAELGEDGEEAYNMRENGSVDILDELDPELIDDPMLRHAVEVAHVDISAVKTRLEQFHGYNLGLHAALTKNADDVYDFGEHYPLAVGSNEYRYGARHAEKDKVRSHIYVYLNAAYEVQKELAVLNNNKTPVTA